MHPDCTLESLGAFKSLSLSPTCKDLSEWIRDGGPGVLTRSQGWELLLLKVCKKVLSLSYLLTLMSSHISSFVCVFISLFLWGVLLNLPSSILTLSFIHPFQSTGSSPNFFMGACSNPAPPGDA
jgi:hypothetical protein